MRFGCVGASRALHTVDSQPLVLVLALGELHHLAQAPSAQRGLRILAKLVARSAAFAGYSRSELVLRPVVAVLRAPRVSNVYSGLSHPPGWELGADRDRGQVGLPQVRKKGGTDRFVLGEG